MAPSPLAYLIEELGACAVEAVGVILFRKGIEWSFLGVRQPTKGIVGFFGAFFELAMNPL